MLDKVSLHEKLFQKPPDYRFRRVFDCLCYPFPRPYNKHKMDFRVAHCVFKGYCSNQPSYKCIDASSCVYVSRHVAFLESVFPFAESNGPFVQSPAFKSTATSAPFFLPFNSSTCIPIDDVNGVQPPNNTSSVHAPIDITYSAVGAAYPSS